jgi:ribosomal protein L30/L7E
MATIGRTASSVKEMQILRYSASPIRRSNAISVLRSLRLWKTFQLTPTTTQLLSEQADLTLKQCEAALDFLVIANVLRLRRTPTGVFVERMKQESEAA